MTSLFERLLVILFLVAQDEKSTCSYLEFYLVRFFNFNYAIKISSCFNFCWKKSIDHFHLILQSLFL